MTQSTTRSTKKLPAFISEIFLLEVDSSVMKSTAFGFSREIDRQTGNRLSYHFSTQLPQVMVTWVKGVFYAITRQGEELPSREDWKKALDNIQAKIDDFKQNFWTFQWMPEKELTPLIISNLAYQILYIDRPFNYKANSIKVGNTIVRKEVRYSSEIFSYRIKRNGEIIHLQKPALSLRIKSKIYYQDTLDKYVEKNPYRNDLEKILVGLKVQVKDKDSQATIVGLGGKVGDNREKLLEIASASVSKEALKNTPDEQRLVLVKFRNSSTSFEYAMSALRPVCNAENAPQLGIEYGSLLKQTKVSYQKRQELLFLYKK